MSTRAIETGNSSRSVSRSSKPLSHLAQTNKNLWYGAKAVAEVLIWTAVTPLAVLLRYDGAIPEQVLGGVFSFTLLALALKAVAVNIFGLHTQSWHRTSANDARTLAVAAASVMTFQLLAVLLAPNVFSVPRSIPLIDAALGFGVLFLLRAATREFIERRYQLPESQKSGNAQKVLVVGAGEAGAMVVKEMLRHPDTGLQPVGFVDDDLTLARLNISGVRVLGTTDDLPAIIDRLQVDQVLIAVPSSSGAFVRQTLNKINKATRKPRHQIVPGVYELLSGDVSVNRIRDVRVEDLLRRPPVNLDLRAIANYVDNETVLITGAGGSIGSEITRQLCHFEPKRLILLGRGENSIFEIVREIKTTFPHIEHTSVIANVADRERIQQVFERYRPTVVFHAAAHKHVPFMEEHPGEAIINNVFGTRNVATLARQHQVKRFVNVSTDKAVNPSSVMGASKRLAETIVRDIAQHTGGDQRFVSVRFGNVLGSRGSVVPLFLKQIRDHGPVTITDRQMTRYFMTIPEASQLVLQAGGLAQNGATYILEMGEPVKILDLAQDVIRLAGFEPDKDIPIVFTGTRPGEKIHEELMTEAEKSAATTHEKIYVARGDEVHSDELERDLAQLEEAVLATEPQVIRSELFRVVGAVMQTGPIVS